MTQTEVTVRRHVVVDAAIDRAFSVFTQRFGDFKPPEHNLLGAPIAETVFEPRVGGHIVDRAVDGTECRWARILVYEPPVRVVFSWDISPQWNIVTDPDLTSEVEVRFHAERRNAPALNWSTESLDRHGPGWASRVGRRGRRRGGRWPGPRPALGVGGPSDGGGDRCEYEGRAGGRGLRIRN